MSAPDNPPAFPVRIESPLGAIDIKPGMTLRDYFAGQALASIADDLTRPNSLAIRAYAIADAMLAERLKP